jgi:uncharacterized protein YjbJ (UPF0337 family)
MPDNIDDAKGQLKEGAGKLTGDKSLESEGKADQVAGKVKDAAEDAKDAVEGVLGSIKDKLSGK